MYIHVYSYTECVDVALDMYMQHPAMLSGKPPVGETTMARTTAAHLDPSKMEQVNGLIMPKFAPKPTRWSFGENAEWPSGRSVSNCRQNDTMPELQKISSVNYEVEMASTQEESNLPHKHVETVAPAVCTVTTGKRGYSLTQTGH